jgi:hypothetical protein
MDEDSSTDRVRARLDEDGIVLIEIIIQLLQWDRRDRRMKPIQQVNVLPEYL